MSSVFGAYSAKKLTQFCDWEQFRFLFYQLSSSLTPFLFFDIQMLLADLTRVQCNRRRNHDRKPFTLTTRKMGVMLITECDGSDPMTHWGGQWRQYGAAACRPIYWC